jgi:hypothetical protein
VLRGRVIFNPKTSIVNNNNFNLIMDLYADVFNLSQCDVIEYNIFSPFWKDIVSETFIRELAKHNRLDIIKLLISHGYIYEIALYNCIRVAALENNIEIVKYLISININPELLYSTDVYIKICQDRNIELLKIIVNGYIIVIGPIVKILISNKNITKENRKLIFDTITKEPIYIAFPIPFIPIINDIFYKTTNYEQKYNECKNIIDMITIFSVYKTQPDFVSEVKECIKSYQNIQLRYEPYNLSWGLYNNIYTLCFLCKLCVCSDNDIIEYIKFNILNFEHCNDRNNIRRIGCIINDVIDNYDDHIQTLYNDYIISFNARDAIDDYDYEFALFNDYIVNSTQ